MKKEKIKKDQKAKMNRKWEKKQAKTSLKKKVNRAMTTSSIVTVLVIATISSAVLYLAINMITGVFIQYSASQMALIISDQWDQDEGMNEETVHMLVDGLAKTKFLDISKPKEDTQHSQEDINFVKSFTENLIHYKVVVYRENQGNKVIYDTEQKYEHRIDLQDIRDFASKFTASARGDIYNFNAMSQDDMIKNVMTDAVSMDSDEMSSYKVGYVEAIINPWIALIFIFVSVFFLVIILIINGVISTFLRFLLSGMITKPVEVIASQLKSISQGDVESTLNKKIEVKNPVKEVKIMMDATNEIIHKTKDFMVTLEEQNYELEAQKEELYAQNTTLEDRSNALASLNDAYLSRTLNFQNLLDNVGQGFMTFGKDLIINPEYSLACESMLCDGGVEGRKIIEIIGDSQSDKDFIEEVLHKIFQAEPDKRDLYTTLLPEEINIEDHIYHVEYKHVLGINGQAQMLVITTDITEQRRLESKVEKEKNTLQMIVRVLMNRQEFINLKKEFEIFINQDFSLLVQEDLEKTLRELHTFKGSFSQYYLNHISEYINEIENQIENENLKIQSLHTKAFLEDLEKDLDLIASYVGQDFFLPVDDYTLNEDKVSDIEFKLKDLLPDYEFNKILPVIQSIRHKSIKSLLGKYSDYTHSLSERLGKPLNPLVISGDDVYVDQSIYNKVIKTLGHVFRNALDHGIESEERRLTLGKNPFATITCKIENHKDAFKIIVEDDGQGVNTEKIKEIAQKKGILYKQDDSVYDLLFKDGFTSKESASLISGRGVGLSSLKYAVEELGGHVSFDSVLNQGTRIEIGLPYISDVALVSFSPEKLMENISRITKEYINTLGINLEEGQAFKSNRITLKRVNALINVKGAVEGVMFLSVNEMLAKSLMKGFVMDEVSEDHLTDYMEDTIGEIANTIIGNVLGTLEAQGVYLTIGVPALISNKEAYMKYSESEIYVIDFISGSSALSLNLLIIDSNDNKLMTGR